jgi:enoyl-CoA hydratase
MTKPVLCEKDNGIVIITINRSQSANTINADVALQISDILNEVSASETDKVVIITGSGSQAFSSGVAKTSIASANFASTISILDNLRCPVIAVINGDAFGEGLELALACDIRIAAPHAHFCLPMINSGRIPSHGSTQRLPRIVGVTKALELILTGEPIDSQEALRIGLISQIVPPDKLLETAKNMAKVMTTKSSLALSFSKEAINKGLDLTLEQGLHLEADLYFLMHTTGDRTEGIKAFREKRKPQFKGR